MLVRALLLGLLAVIGGLMFKRLEPIYFHPFHSPFYLEDTNRTQRTFCNFDRRQCCDADAVANPLSVVEVQRLVREAAAAGTTVRVVGAGHSMSTLVCGGTERWGTLVSLDHMRQIVKIDKERAEVTVEAGLRLRELNLALAAEGLSLFNMGLIDEQSVAGLIATGVHGSGIELGTVSTAVASMDVVVANGTVVTLSATQRPDIFQYSRLHLGAFGVVVRVTLRVRPQLYLRREQSYTSFEDALDTFHNNVRTLRNFQMWIVTYTDSVQLNSIVEVPQEQATPLQRAPWFIKFEKIFTDVVFLIMTFVCNLVPSADLWMFKILPIAMPPKAIAGEAREILTFPGINFHSVRYTESEYFIPIGNAVGAIRAAENFTRANRDRCPVNAFHPVRTVKGDDIPHSPAYQQDSVTISFVLVNRHETFDVCAEELDGVMKGFGGRPHWGKRNWLDRESAKALYGEAAMRGLANAIRQMDPAGMFKTNNLKALLP
jgi:FAD/FMN-containing dehydrogenase